MNSLYYNQIVNDISIVYLFTILNTPLFLVPGVLSLLLASRSNSWFVDTSFFTVTIPKKPSTIIGDIYPSTKTHFIRIKWLNCCQFSWLIPFFFPPFLFTYFLTCSDVITHACSTVFTQVLHFSD